MKYISKDGSKEVEVLEVTTDGYTGYKRFVGAGNLVFFESDTAPGEFDKVWNKLCK